MQVVNFNVLCSYVPIDIDAQLLTKMDPMMSLNLIHSMARLVDKMVQLGQVKLIFCLA